MSDTQNPAAPAAPAAPDIGPESAAPIATQKPRIIRQFELVDRVRAYDPNIDEDKLNRAYVFSMKAHGSQLRASGDPYFSHPLEVAGILTDMKLDTATICTALLHDTVEDTLATLEDIEKLFGGEIARLVDGVTKLSRIEYQSEQSKQAENFRKLLLAMSEDIRVLLVKLADRLHNMRTLHYVPKPEKRRRIARETIEIYAQLAERIGIRAFQEEMEDIAFGELFPDARQSILARLEFLRNEGGGDLTGGVVSELQEVLQQSGLRPDIQGREKTAYSIWKKMQRKNVTFEQLSDIMAFRIVVDSVEQCYQALGVLHSRYPMVPGRFKDYISTPKPNGYQSLHTGLLGPNKQRVEIQIRTRAMHEVSELGVAAHWSYKAGDAKPTADSKQYRWLRELLDILENAQRPEEFLDYTRLELFQEQVFCFTPKGDVVALPRGACPVDFAYAVHSGVGDKCVGAKVNSRMVPLRTVLQNGDQVEIITSKTQTPSPAWERFVVSAKARSAIRKYIRSQQRSEHMVVGKAMLQKIFLEANMPFEEKLIEPHVRQFQAQSLDDLYANLGASLHSPREVLTAVYPQAKNKPAAPTTTPASGKALLGKAMPRPGEAGKPLTLRGLIPGMAVHYARCCHPLPGDRIVGIVTTGKGVTVHTVDCETLNSFVHMPERWVDVAWEDETDIQDNTIGRIVMVVGNQPGSLGMLSTVIGKQGGNISNLKITDRNEDFYEIVVDIQVKNLPHLTNIIAALRATPAINSVERARGR